TLAIIAVLLSISIAFFTTKQITKPIKQAVDALDSIAHGNLNVSLESTAKDETGQLIAAMRIMSNSLKDMIKELNIVSTAATDGKLDHRANEGKFEGEFSTIMNGFNRTLDAVIGPLNVTAEYVDRISKGDIPPVITDNYKGDFNEIKSNINQLIDSTNKAAGDLLKISNGDFNVELITRSDNDVLIISMKALLNNLSLVVNDLKGVNESTILGKLDARVDASKHKGDYKVIVEGINQTLNNVIGPLNVTAEYVDRISKGDIPPVITDNYKGDFNEIKNNINGLIDNLNSFIKDMSNMSHQHDIGDIDVKIDSDKYNGAFRNMAQGVNDMVFGHISVKKKAIACFEEFGNGNLDASIETFPGKKIFINNAIENVRGKIKLLVSDTAMLATAAVEGKLDVRADLSKHKGDYRKIVEGINNTLDNVIGPLNVAADYVEKISKGDIPDRITAEYKGNFNGIKQSLNGLIDNLSSFIIEMENFNEKHVAGDFDYHFDTSKFVGAYRMMGNGVDKAVHFYVKTIADILEVVGEYGDGKFDKVLRPLPGKQATANDTVNQIKLNLSQVANELNNIIGYALDGDLSARGDVNKYQGAYKEIIGGLNNMLDSIELPLNRVNLILNNVSDFDFTSNMNEDYKGVWNELKQSMNTTITNLLGVQELAVEVGYGDLNKLDLIRKMEINKNNKTTPAFMNMMEAINLLINDVAQLSDYASKGMLSERIDVSTHKGKYQDLARSLNNTIDTLLAPVNEAVETIGQMSTGDLTVRMYGDYQGDLAKLKDDINILGDSLSQLITQVNESVQNTASAALQISSTAEGLAASSQEQSAQADEVASAVEEMSRTVTDNAMSATKTAEVAQHNGEVASEGARIVKQTVTKMRDIADVVKHSAENIQKLGESSKQIGEIISVIDDIADQTNLLALNAAIEAARAGEQGRGFAVVADEVRKLAERTTEATKQIANMIKGIQSETEMAVTAMNQGTVEVQSGIDYADRAGESLNAILTSTQELLDMINQIAAASEEQSATSEQIAKNVMSISKVTSESTQRIEDVAHTSEELAKLTEHLRNLMANFQVDETNGGFGSRQLSSKQKKQLHGR
ncbi:MAG TPA: methyl-accepting chemotaxis protein, partial [Candidatus Kapabacteria bacterium]|nr:methyl-accepting chemotaxis protein [Candidatus Kapabacteria bacterium]